MAELTEAEWEIMRVVWEKEPWSAGTVQEALAATRDWCYATVKLTMDRMVAKGFLEIDRIRNLQLFRSCLSEVEARRGELRKTLKRAFGGLGLQGVEHQRVWRADAPCTLVARREADRAR